MKAVILAAGLGKRLGAPVPKPLVRLYGLTLLEHKIRRLSEEEIIVVYSDERVKQFLEKNYPRVKTVYNPDPYRENGFSLYCAKDYIDKGERFLLLMADHYYGDHFYLEAENVEANTIFVSKNSFQEDEATKVKVEGGYVVEIGKGINSFDYFDTGFFVCGWDVFDAIESILDKEKIKLSDCMQVLANRKKLKYKVIDDFWIDIDTGEDLEQAEKQIRNSLVKETDGFISKILNRKISTAISPFLIRYNIITPNLITVFVSILGFLAGFLFFLKYYLLGGILTQVVSVLDGCDGEVARIKRLSSKYGAVLDSVMDRYVDLAILTGIFLSVEKSILTDIMFVFALSGSIMVSYVSHLSGVRPLFATRDVRLFLIMVFGMISFFNAGVISMIFPVLAFITQGGVIYSIWRR